MKEPRISRPEFPEGYLRDPKTYLPWSHVEQRMTKSLHYWLCTVRPDGRPHTVPRWGVWLDGKLYYDGSPKTRHARNLAHNPQVSLHLESGENVVIMYGTAREADIPASELAQCLAQAIGEKYGERGYTPKANQWDQGGLFIFTPKTVLAWTQFMEDPDATRFIFDTKSEEG